MACNGSTNRPGFRLPVADLAEADLETALAEAAAEPFDLAEGPLVRASVYRLAADDHVLALIMHHVVTDGWSAGVLTTDLAALYQAELTGVPADLPALPVRYRDFAAWQRGRTEVMDTQLRHWQQVLADVPALELPTDRPRPPAHTTAGAHLEFTVPAEVADALRTVASGHDGALFAAMALLAPTANTTIVTHQLLLTPDELRGRLSGTLNVAVGAAGALGPALGGLLAETTTPTTAVLVTAAGLTAAALAATVNRTLRHYPERKETPCETTPPTES